MALIKKYSLYIIGAFVGSMLGFLYYYFIGCSSGSCMITSKPINSARYGALMGGLLVGVIKK